jgi:hypothetical protein
MVGMIMRAGGASRQRASVKYDFACQCGAMVRRMKGADKRCPQCGGKSTRRVKRSTPDNRLIDVASMAVKYQNRFPYVSSAFPFGGKGARHVGARRQCLIESSRHEEAMRGAHGYVGEKGITGRASGSSLKDPAAANRAFYG